MVAWNAGMLFMSTDNVVWSLPGAFRTPTPIVAAVGIQSVHFTGLGCSGTPYVSFSIPRYSMQFGGGTYGTINDNAPMAIQVDILSSADGPPPLGVCNNPSLSYQIFGVPLTAVREVTLPTSLPGSPPYYPEFVP